MEDLGKKLKVDVQDCVKRATRELREHEERVEILLADTKEIEESARVFKRGQKAMEAFQRRVIEEKIREAVKESESRCDQNCARRLEVTSKAARVLITEAMQAAITQAGKTSRSFTQEQNTIQQHKMIRKFRELEDRCEAARDAMESKCMDAAKLCCEDIVTRQSEIQGKRMDSISERLRSGIRALEAARDEALTSLEQTIVDRVERESRNRFQEISHGVHTEHVRVLRESDNASKHRLKIEHKIQDVEKKLERLRDHSDERCKELVERESVRQNDHARVTREKLNAQLESHMTAMKISTRSDIRDINAELRRYVEQSEKTIRSEQRVLGESVADRLQLIWSDMLNTVHEETASRLRGDAALRARLISQEQSTRELRLNSEARGNDVEIALKTVRSSSFEIDRKIESIREESEVASVLSSMVDRIVHSDSRERLHSTIERRMSEVEMLRSEIVGLKQEREIESRESKVSEVHQIIDNILSDVVSSAELRNLQHSIEKHRQCIENDRDVSQTLLSMVNRVSDECERERYENVLHNTRLRSRDEIEYLQSTVSMLSQQRERIDSIICGNNKVENDDHGEIEEINGGGGGDSEEGHGDGEEKTVDIEDGGDERNGDDGEEKNGDDGEEENSDKGEEDEEQQTKEEN